MAPIIASSQSKSKLRAFQFDGDKQGSDVGHNLEESEAEKENINNLGSEGRTTAAQLGPRAQTLSQRSAGNETRECPQTPVGRLALAELIASGEDLNHQNLNLTPTERVLWDQSPHNFVSASSGVSRKGKKRVHSSSPPSSSQNEASNHFSTSKTTLDLQTLRKCLRTPQADPANDLWSRYSVTNERQSPTENIDPPFAHLLDPSSPQTPANLLRTKESGGLRRSVSCTTAWPTSVTKRRKLEHNRRHEEEDAAFPATEGNTVHSTSKRSRVSLLVNRLHDELAGSRKAGSKDAVIPSSSSPLPEKGGFSHVALITAPRSSQTDVYDHTSTASHDEDDAEAQISQQSPQPPDVTTELENANCTDSDSFSDFGDDDLDLEMLKAVDEDVAKGSSAVSLETDQQLGSRSSGSGFGYGQSKKPLGTMTSRSLDSHDAELNALNFKPELNSNSKKITEAAVYIDSAQIQPPQVAIVANYDEFDEDTNDISAADLEDAVAMYDLQPQTHTLERCQPSPRDELPTKLTGIGTTTDSCRTTTESYPGNGEFGVVDLSSDDEFGGALDFEQIIAECSEATQVAQIASQSQSSVCIRRFGQSI